MKVCVLMPFFDAFKGGNHLSLFAACTEIQFTIVTSRCRSADVDLPSNITVEIIPARLGPYYYGIADMLFGRVIMKKYSKYHSFWKQFDVIHLNQTFSTRFIQLIHTDASVLYTIHHPVTVDCAIAIQESLSVFQKIQWWLKYALLRKAQNKLCNTLPHIMTVSETIKKRLQHDYGVSAQKISVVPNGVDGTIFTPVHTSTSDVIAVGSFIHPRKGFSYLARVYRALSAKGYTIADVGRRSDEQRAILESIPGVTIYGTVDGDALISLVQHSRCLVSTSLYEGFGLSLIEALSCGIPAFAFSVGAVDEVLESVDPTLVVPCCDTTEMTKHIDAFLQSSEEHRVSKGKEYRNAVLQRYSMDKAAKRLFSLYTDLTQ